MFATSFSKRVDNVPFRDHISHGVRERFFVRLAQVARFLVQNGFEWSSRVHGDHGPAHVHRLDRNDAKVFVRRRVDQARGSCKQSQLLLVVERSDERHVVCEVVFVSEIYQLQVVLFVFRYAFIITA